MAGRGAVERECNRLNQSRQVREIGEYSYHNFWRETHGSFMIAGGSAEERAKALAECLVQTLEYGGEPTIVLTGSPLLAQRMAKEGERLSGVLSGRGRFLRITSGCYPNYAFFDGWSRQEIVYFFQQSADRFGYASEEMAAYANAVLDILNSTGRYSLNLESIFALSCRTDEEIRDIGRRNGAAAHSIDTVDGSPEGGKNYRLILEHLMQGMDRLTSRDYLGNEIPMNLLNERLNHGCVHLIHMESRFPEVLNLYLAEELRRLTTRRQSVRILCNDLYLDEEDKDELKKFLVWAQASAYNISVSSSNPGIFGDDFLNRFQNYLILPRTTYERGGQGRYTHVALESFLKPLGTYIHYEPVLAKDSNPFSLFAGSNWSPNGQERLKVRPEDTDGFDAVLYGCSGSTILLARNIR